MIKLTNGHALPQNEIRNRLKQAMHRHNERLHQDICEMYGCAPNELWKAEEVWGGLEVHTFKSCFKWNDTTLQFDRTPYDPNRIYTEKELSCRYVLQRRNPIPVQVIHLKLA